MCVQSSMELPSLVAVFPRGCRRHTADNPTAIAARDILPTAPHRDAFSRRRRTSNDAQRHDVVADPKRTLPCRRHGRRRHRQGPRDSIFDHAAVCRSKAPRGGGGGSRCRRLYRATSFCNGGGEIDTRPSPPHHAFCRCSAGIASNRA